MKPRTNVPGIPFNFDYLPLLIEPNLWDESQSVSWRGPKLVLLYALSMGVAGGLIFVPLLLWARGHGNSGIVLVVMWAIQVVLLGGGFGLVAWRDFVRYSKDSPTN
jgi:hypothetical protein